MTFITNYFFHVIKKKALVWEQIERMKRIKQIWLIAQKACYEGFATKFRLVWFSRANSLWPLHSSHSCGGIEFMATTFPHHDLACRTLNDSFFFSPRQADILVMEPSQKMAPYVKFTNKCQNHVGYCR
jgi:NADH:ubiquinone oxidoreductase subunit B-like Fe-S oxidoreductase